MLVHVDSGKDLQAFIQQALNRTDAINTSADEYRTNHFYELDGRASERFVANLEQLYKNHEHENIPY